MGTVEIFDDRRCRLGEGPFYDERTDRVWWVDILGRRLLWRTVASGDAGELHLDEHVGAVVPDRADGLVVCLPAGPAALAGAATAATSGPVRPVPIARFPVDPAGPPALRANDAKVDPAGRLWLGTMAYDDVPGAGALYRLDPGTQALHTMVEGVTISNGLGWSPFAPVMYYIDTPTGQVDVFDYDPSSGATSNRRRFVRVEGGHPDGLCVDAEGCLWVAVWLGAAVCRYTPDGDLDRMIAVPAPRVTSCAFAGEDLRTLVITTAALSDSDDAAGRTYAYRPGDVVGLPVDRFGGLAAGVDPLA
jgi:sugar lactone lactonase YvrE